ncbi:MAG: proton-conducting transporter membrane subunit [Candidatus Gastranaerophilales bacterium]|nr:proton-conducting transporter membrane subunit [Candidatus Gastranaerophilales bacterium]
MMIETILIFPIIASIILFLIKSKKLNNLALIGYSIVLLFNSVMIYSKLISAGKLPYNLFGAYFNVDSLNILFLLILVIIFIGVVIYNQGFIKNLDINENQHTYYSIGILLFIFSMTGAILSANLALSWVFIEATTLASAYLIYFNKTKHSLEATWKYVFICSIGIALAFVGIILLSIGTGQYNSLFFNELYLNADKIAPFWLKLSFVFILIGFGTKIGLAPVHAWLPDAHSEAPSPISALLSATLLNSAFLIILRVYKLMELTNLDHYARILLISMGILSLFITAVFVFNINNYKRMLAYSSIENMGIIAIGIAVGGLGIYAAMLHLLAHSLIKSSFFLTAGNILKLYKTKKINEISGILKQDKLTGWLWILCFVGIAGLPPSPLFISEFLLLKAMFDKNQFILALIFIIFLTVIIFGIGKSILKMSFGDIKTLKITDNQPITSEHSALKDISLSMYMPQLVFIGVSLILGIYMPSFINQMLHNAALAISSVP